MTRHLVILSICTLLLASGCASVGIAGSGPSARAVAAGEAGGIRVVPLTVAAAREASTPDGPAISELPAGAPFTEEISRGDSLEITIWEAAPATLFGAGQDAAAGRAVVLPVQTVGLEGEVSVPFAGRVQAAGRTAQALAQEIVRRLTAKAHRPQVIVRNASHAAQEVTVIGQVKESRRLPLTPKGERVLDAIASAGGPSVPVEKATVQVTRAGLTAASPLEAIVRDPAQNVVLASHDIVAVYFQPKSFVALGAVNQVGEIDFEATGLTLAQALARAGGTVDNRADARGLFLARVVAGEQIVYQVDLRDPASFFAMREFQVRDDDVVYVANSPATELQKFLGILGAAVYPIDAVRTMNRD